MLTLQLPMLLALAGTVLMAVVIFAPAPHAANVTVSLAPPVPTAPHWTASYAASSSGALADAPFPEHWKPTAALDEFTHRAELSPQPPAWPSLIDPRAACCDAEARLALVDSLAAVRAPWAQAILLEALDGEPDALVRGAVAAALGGAADDR